MSTFDGSRRGFLKGAATLAGAAAVQAIHARAFAGGNDLIRIGMVGCGNRGTGAANDALSAPGSNVKLVAICDAFEARIATALDILKKKHGDKVDVAPDKHFTGLDGYKKIFEHCDLVLLCTPPGFRPQQFEAAVAAGKHVFMEKPVAIDAVGARRVLGAAKKADEKNLRVVCGLQRHYQTVYTETYDRLKNGQFGEILSGQVYWNQGATWYRKKTAEQNDFEFQLNNWHHFNWVGGDHICEQHVHNMDVANWFIGENPVSATGLGGRSVPPLEGPTETYDHFYTELRYAKNGIVIASQCRQISGTKSDVREEFHTTKGILHIHGNGKGDARFTDFAGKDLWVYEGSKEKDKTPYVVEHSEHHRFIRDGIAHNDAHHSANSSFTGALGRTATYSGQELKFAELLSKKWSVFPDGELTLASPAPCPLQKDGTYRIPVPGDYKIVEKA